MAAQRDVSSDRAPAVTATREALLAVEHVSKRFETSEGVISAVDDVSFSIAPGEFVSIIGPSGCGKSTLLNIGSGLAAPSEGADIVADYASLGLTLGRHPLALLRGKLKAMGLGDARELHDLPHGIGLG